jgi:hypothetical protein
MTAPLRLVPREEPLPLASVPCDLAAAAAHLLRGQPLTSRPSEREVWGECVVPQWLPDAGPGREES